MTINGRWEKDGHEKFPASDIDRCLLCAARGQDTNRPSPLSPNNERSTLCFFADNGDRPIVAGLKKRNSPEQILRLTVLSLLSFDLTVTFLNLDGKYQYRVHVYVCDDMATPVYQDERHEKMQTHVILCM